MEAQPIHEIDEHVEEHTDAAGGIKLDSSGVICQVFTATRPILVFVKNLLFFRPKWQAVLSMFIKTLDETCSNDIAVP